MCSPGEAVMDGDDHRPMHTSDQISGETVLVTGGAGFIGSHIVAALDSNNRVRVLDNLTSGSRAALPDDVEFVHGDVRDEHQVKRALADVDVVFHEAAMVDVPESTERPLACHDRNATATVGLLDQARRADARVVLASSAAVYGDPESVPVSEEAQTRPRSPYGASKLASDHYGRVFAERYGLPVVSLRYFNVYGPRRTPTEACGVVGQFVRKARNGDPLSVHGQGDQTRDFVHVADVVRANLAAATATETPAVYNVGTGRSITIRELATLVAEESSADVTVRHEQGRDGDIQRSRADISKTTAELGFEPQVGIRDGVASLLGDHETWSSSTIDP
ncbi:NAD-dependent epimerase/dehydratase family protein [Halorientalis marina]|uniref:NAD-dependent epimerase/dehydratase family protein n=1 Tax=Halorientalis marina TaxID=2931976 RepID=UPI001FF6068F|nr:NAD-dependent epimerase/dehydratase family protein [Halorientalis marina]